ncbi:MAG: hypothetical protein EOO07_16210, partial [Chitinophagaceae bacterium]
MKAKHRIIAVIFMTIASLQSYGQFKLSGRIINYSGTEDLKINIPVVFGFHKENSTPISIAKDGTFKITLPVSGPKFANLIFERKFFTMLLNPGKDLA